MNNQQKMKARKPKSTHIIGKNDLIKMAHKALGDYKKGKTKRLTRFTGLID